MLRPEVAEIVRAGPLPTEDDEVEAVENARLLVDAILSTALDLADREGLKALSMRRLCASLGVEAMVLY